VSTINTTLPHYLTTSYIPLLILSTLQSTPLRVGVGVGDNGALCGTGDRGFDGELVFWYLLDGTTTSVLGTTRFLVRQGIDDAVSSAIVVELLL
jgi:hypothetical protein